MNGSNGRMMRLTSIVLLCALSAGSARAHDGHHHTGTPKTSATERPVTRTVRAIPAPSIALVRDDKQDVNLADELQAATGPVYLNFIFTSCTSVCPLMTDTFSGLQRLLEATPGNARLMSISIDPEHDTPERLATYREQFSADAAWRFYSGSNEDIDAARKAFGVYTRDKMNHPVVAFFRPTPGTKWVRLDGFASPEELLRENRVRAAR